MNDREREGRTDHVRRTIAASAEALYDAFRDGETLMRWLPPKNMTGRALVYEFEPGGHYQIELRYPEESAGSGKTTGDSDVSKGRFLELKPGRTIRQSVEFESDDAALARAMTMTWSFAPHGDGTEVMVTAEGVPAAIRKEDHLEGMNASLDNLTAFVADRMRASAGARARMPNPALSPLAFLIGEWRTEGTHPTVPHKTLPGRTSFAWSEGGAFLIMRAEVHEPGFPDGIAIVGSDDSAGTFGMLYFDERGTSRRFEVVAAEGRMAWHRDDPTLAQDYVIRAEGKDRLVSTGRISKDGGDWADDLSQVYVRIG